MRSDILPGGIRGLFCPRPEQKTAAKRQPCTQKPILGHELMILGSPCPQKAVFGHGCCVGSNLTVLVLPIKKDWTPDGIQSFVVDYTSNLSNFFEDLKKLDEFAQYIKIKEMRI